MRWMVAGILAVALLGGCGGGAEARAAREAGRISSREMAELRQQLGLLSSGAAGLGGPNAPGSSSNSGSSSSASNPAAVPQDPIPCNPGPPAGNPAGH